MANERTLDVRDAIRAGGEPFDAILQAVSELADSEDLILLAPFEPVPLYGVLAAKGFAHVTQALVGGDYQVRFTRSGV